jgi:hypothetical protein
MGRVLIMLVESDQSRVPERPLVHLIILHDASSPKWYLLVVQKARATGNHKIEVG